MLRFYRAALDLRRAHMTGGLEWLDAPDGVLAFDRGDRISCAINLSAQPYRLAGDVLIASDDVAGGALPADAAAWLRRVPPSGARSHRR